MPEPNVCDNIGQDTCVAIWKYNLSDLGTERPVSLIYTIGRKEVVYDLESGVV